MTDNELIELVRSEIYLRDPKAMAALDQLRDRMALVATGMSARELKLEGAAKQAVDFILKLRFPEDQEQARLRISAGEQVIEALDTAIGMAPATPEPAINAGLREELLSWLNSLLSQNCYNVVRCSRRDVLKYLNALLAATPETESGWISVKERLPEKESLYLVRGGSVTVEFIAAQWKLSRWSSKPGDWTIKPAEWMPIAQADATETTEAQGDKSC